ncbi:MAG: nucleotide-binding domain containing protein [Hyphomicrobiaceae bacterium]
MALGLPQNFIAKGLMQQAPAPTSMAAPQGRAAILAGSCSEATRGQIATAKAAGLAALEVDPLALAAGQQSADAIIAWCKSQPADKPFLVYSSADPATVATIQAKLGREEAGALVEHTRHCRSGLGYERHHPA